jgi:hypothetical protein
MVAFNRPLHSRCGWLLVDSLGKELSPDLHVDCIGLDHFRCCLTSWKASDSRSTKKWREHNCTDAPFMTWPV